MRDSDDRWKFLVRDSDDLLIPRWRWRCASKRLANAVILGSTKSPNSVSLCFSNFFRTHRYRFTSEIQPFYFFPGLTSAGDFVECPHSPEEPSGIGDSFPLTIINSTIIYVFNPSSGDVLKYVIGTGQHPDCPAFLRSYRPSWGVYGTPTKAWSSVDGSRIFLDNGLTLTASEDENLDMRERGSFDGTFTKQSIESVTQVEVEPYIVYAYHGLIESSLLWENVEPGFVASYSYPFLERIALIEVPAPNSSYVVTGEKSPEAFVRLSRNDQSLFVVTNYTDAATQTSVLTGIATIPLWAAWFQLQRIEQNLAHLHVEVLRARGDNNFHFVLCGKRKRTNFLQLAESPIHCDRNSNTMCAKLWAVTGK